jgi:hypothetical protein
VLASFAPCERLLISQRTREALAHKRSQGVRLGRPPTMSQYVIDRIKRDRKPARAWPRSRTDSTPIASHRPGRPPLVSSHHPTHTQPSKLTLQPRRFLRELRQVAED